MEPLASSAARRRRRGMLLVAALVALPSCRLFRRGDTTPKPPPAAAHRAMWVGEQYPDGLVVLGDVPPEVSVLLAVPVFETAAPVTIQRVPSGPAPDTARLFRICDQRPGDSYPRLDNFRGPVPRDLPAPRPIVAWEEASAFTPRWYASDVPPATGWEAKARKVAGKAEHDTLAAVPFALDDDPAPEMYVEVRQYPKPTKTCRFPYETIDVVLDDDWDVLGKREAEGCFTNAPFDPMGTVSPPCAEGDGRAECRWPPETHGGPYPAIFGPGAVPIALDAGKRRRLWLRHAMSFEGEHFLVERLDGKDIVTDSDTYFYHCAF